MKILKISQQSRLIKTACLSIFAIVILLLTTSVSFGQNGTDYSGTWSFNEAKSNLGDSQFRMAATTLVVLQKGNDLTIDRTQSTYEGEEVKTNEKYTLDGKDCTNTGVMNSSRVSKVTWSEDKKSLTYKTTIKFEREGEVMEISSTEIWKMSADAKTLTVESAMTSPWGDMNTTNVYDKK